MGTFLKSFDSGNSVFTREFLTGAGVEELIIHGLNAHDRRDTQHVVSVGSARNISGRPVQSQQDLAVGVGSGEVAGQLAGDIARVQVRKNEHIGVANNPPARRLPSQ